MRLIVSADDFGYYPEVSAGIADCITAGSVTATAILANAPDFEAAVAQLRALPQADAGVHLNLTTGRPLSAAMQTALGGRPFPGLARMAALLMLRPHWRQTALREFDTQIARCRAAGLEPLFLNSHQHIHMLPVLYGPTLELARVHGIRHVRHTRPDGLRLGPRAWLRERLFALGSVRRAAAPGTPVFLGLAASGRLNLDYLRHRLAGLPADATCELMCHPGRTPAASQPPPALTGYHDWAGERELLLSPAFRRLLTSHGITLIRYRDLA